MQEVFERKRGERPAEGSSSTARRRVGLSPTACCVALIFLLALGLRLAWIAYSEAEPTFEDDTGRYDFWAQRAAEGKDPVHFLSGAPTAFGAPGYAFVLGALYFLVGHSVLAAQVLNAFLGAATVVLAFFLGRKVAGRGAGVLSALIVAFFPSQIFFTSVLLTEVLFTALLLLILLLLFWQAEAARGRALLLLLLGLVLGCATVVRGESLLLLLLAPLFWIFLREDWVSVLRKTGIVVVVMAAVLAPWTIRNFIRMGSFVVLTTHGGVTLWVGHHPGADGRFHFADELIMRYGELSPPEREVRVNNDGFREALDFAVHNPLEEVKLFGKKLFWTYRQDEEGIYWNEAHGALPFLDGTVRRALLTASNAYYFAVLGLFALSVPLWWSWRRHPGRFLLVITFVYWTVTHAVFIGEPRYHFPIMVIVAILVAAAAVSVWEGMKPGRGSSAPNDLAGPAA